MKFISKVNAGNCPSCGAKLQSSRTRTHEQLLVIFGYRPRRCSGCQQRFFVKRG